MSLFVLGSTGLVGGFIIEASLQSKTWSKVTTLTRRKPQFANNNNIDAIVETDTTKWSSIIQNDVKTQAPQAYISSFGTTRATAGSAEQFRAIDYGINYDAAKSAKEIGVKTCILISTIGANANSPFLYFQTKGQLEDAIIALNFDHTIILRPGSLLGDRGGSRNDWPHRIATFVQNSSFVSSLLKSIPASDVGKVAVDFAERAERGDLKEKVTIVGGGELLELAAKNGKS